MGLNLKAPFLLLGKYLKKNREKKWKRKNERKIKVCLNLIN